MMTVLIKTLSLKIHISLESEKEPTYKKLMK